MPFAFRQAGVGLGTLILIFIAVITDYSLILMVRGGQLSGTTSYQVKEPKKVKWQRSHCNFYFRQWSRKLLESRVTCWFLRFNSSILSLVINSFFLLTLQKFKGPIVAVKSRFFLRMSATFPWDAANTATKVFLSRPKFLNSSRDPWNFNSILLI